MKTTEQDALDKIIKDTLKARDLFAEVADANNLSVSTAISGAINFIISVMDDENVPHDKIDAFGRAFELAMNSCPKKGAFQVDLRGKEYEKPR